MAPLKFEQNHIIIQNFMLNLINMQYKNFTFSYWFTCEHESSLLCILCHVLWPRSVVGSLCN